MDKKRCWELITAVWGETNTFSISRWEQLNGGGAEKEKEKSGKGRGTGELCHRQLKTSQIPAKLYFLNPLLTKLLLFTSTHQNLFKIKPTTQLPCKERAHCHLKRCRTTLPLAESCVWDRRLHLLPPLLWNPPRHPAGPGGNSGQIPGKQSTRSLAWELLK